MNVSYQSLYSYLFIPRNTNAGFSYISTLNSKVWILHHFIDVGCKSFEVRTPVNDIYFNAILSNNSGNLKDGRVPE